MKTQNYLYYLLILCLICGSTLSCSRQPADKSVVRDMKYKQSLKEVYKRLGIFCTLNDVPGLSVAVSIDNKLVLADGFGYSSKELKTKASPSNVYRIGQVSELITTLTAAKLAEQGKLSLDKPVKELFPDLSTKPLNYTIYQLGTHVSGIRDQKKEAGKDDINTNEALIPTFINDDLYFEPGTTVLHTELGIDLMGYLIQKSSNEPFLQMVKKTLCDNLKLSGTMPDNPYLIFENKSNQYNYDYIAQPSVAYPIDLRGKEASAGYLSSVLDMVKLGNALLYPGFLKEETLKMFNQPYTLTSGQKSPYGFGLIVNKDIQGHPFYGQKGMVSGGTATLLIYPEDKMVVAMAANIGKSSWELPVFDVASVFQNQLHPDWAANANENQKK